MIKNRKKINYKKFTIAIIIITIALISIIFGIKQILKNTTTPNVREQSKSQEPAEIQVVIPDDTVINLVATGDVMCHTTNFNAAYNKETDTYDFSPVFTEVAKYISKADIAISNLETTFAGKDRGYTGYPTFNSPESLGQTLKNIGIDVVSTANNHSLDKGYSGIESTLNTLDEIGIDHVGTARSNEEQNTVLVKNVNGIKIAFLSYTYGTNGIRIPSGKEYSVNLIDKNLILEQIQAAKAQNVDIICTSMHWGVEYAQSQNTEQEDLSNFLFQNGVDIIIGNHAHVIEPMEKKTIILEDGTEKDVFVVYALGNFISGQTIEHTQSTAILDMQIRKNGQTGKISIDSIDYIPVYCYDSKKKSNDRYKLINIRSAITAYESGNFENISESLYNKLKSELSNIEKILGKPVTKEN